MPGYTTVRTAINEKADMELINFFFQELRSGAVWLKGWKDKLRKKIEQLSEKGDVKMSKVKDLQPDFSRVSRVSIDFTPVIIMDVDSKQPLRTGVMTKESWDKTLESGKVCLWSMTRGILWTPGEISGNVMRVRRIMLDCSGYCVVVYAQVEGEGKVCQDGSKTCFYNVWRACPKCVGKLVDSTYGFLYPREAVSSGNAENPIWLCEKCNYWEYVD